IVRKHCGQQKKWHIGLKSLHKKVGSASPLKKFKLVLKHIIDHDHLPDYQIALEQDNVVFYYNGFKEKITVSKDIKQTILKPDTIEKAKKILKQQYDVYALEFEWKCWWEDCGKPELKSQDGAFINFCKSRMKKLEEE
ncbi:MAG: replication initiator protein A, partial [Mycoplasmataceae bacterium]|nr:replication initiator protein A [Mycoplasmataceae bacterium]